MLVVGLIVIGVGGTVGREVGKQFISGNQSKEELLADVTKGFQQAATQLNATTPTMVDDVTRLDNVSVGPGALISYHYTFTHVSSKDVGLSEFKSKVFPIVKKAVCTNQEMKELLEYDGNYKYSYSGNDGKFIGDFTIDRHDCGYSSKY